MSGFRLQTFSPEPGSGASAGLPAPALFTEEQVAAARDAAYEEGYLEGHAVASDAHLKDQARLTSDFIEALNDARLTNDAARRHVVASLAPLITTLCDVIAPALAADGLAGEVAGRVERAVASAPGATPRILCAPETQATIVAILTARDLAGTVETSPRLLAREVELHWDEGFDRIDLDACVAEIRSCIASHLDQAQSATEQNGPERD